MQRDGFDVKSDEIISSSVTILVKITKIHLTSLLATAENDGRYEGQSVKSGLYPMLDSF